MSDKKTRSALKSLITTNFPSSTGAISAANLREWANAITESAMLLLEAGEVEYIVTSMSLTTPPGSPSDGDTYVVGASATGAWSGQDNNVAIWDGDESPAAWNFVAVTDGMGVWNLADDTEYRWDAGASPAAWTAQSGGGGGGGGVTVTTAKVTTTRTAQNFSSSPGNKISWDAESRDDSGWWASGDAQHIVVGADGDYSALFQITVDLLAAGTRVFTRIMVDPAAGGSDVELGRADYVLDADTAVTGHVARIFTEPVALLTGDKVYATLYVTDSSITIYGDAVANGALTKLSVWSYP